MLISMSSTPANTRSSATVSSPVAPPVRGDEPTAQVENSQSINDSGIGLEGIE